jgi:hypothetical protein
VLKLIKIPTYILSIENSYLTDNTITTIQNDGEVITLNKATPNLNFYSMKDYKKTTEPSSYPIYFTEKESVFSKYTLPKWTFVMDHPLFLDNVVWCKFENKLSVINKDKQLQEFFNVKSYQFDNERFALLQLDELNFYDYNFNKIDTFSNITNFKYRGNELFTIRQGNYISQSIDKYNLDSGIKIISSTINKQFSYDIIGIDEDYVYTREDIFKARSKGSLNHKADLMNRTTVIDGHEVLVIYAEDEHRHNSTYYITPTWNFDVGVHPV